MDERRNQVTQELEAAYRLIQNLDIQPLAGNIDKMGKILQALRDAWKYITETGADRAGQGPEAGADGAGQGPEAGREGNPEPEG